MTIPKRARTRKPVAGLDPSVEELFLTGDCPRDTAGWDLKVSRFFDQGAELKAAWEEHSKFLTAKWKKNKRSEKPWAMERFDK